jgi:G:T/U-mismatch repair DNA glycosylase
MIETHPFGVYMPKSATCIILGTFPTHNKNWRFNSFYPGRNNFFWRLLGDVYTRTYQYTTGPEAAAERLALCTEKGLALSDVIYKCRRIVATSSKDSDLEIVEKMDNVSLLRKHPNINRVILTSSSGPVSAHKIFFEHLTENGIGYMVSESKPPIHGSFVLDGRTIETHTLYSPSGTNIGRYAQALQQYKNWLPS